MNGGNVAPMKPFSQQMGVADKYAMDAARMAMSHPAMLDHADRPHVQFGSVAQFRVRRHRIAGKMLFKTILCFLVQQAGDRG